LQQVRACAGNRAAEIIRNARGEPAF
jgi:hypothetical protein